MIWRLVSIVVICLAVQGASSAAGRRHETGFLDRAVTMGGVEYRYEMTRPTIMPKWSNGCWFSGAANWLRFHIVTTAQCERASRELRRNYEFRNGALMLTFIRTQDGATNTLV
jgi:hypothetical protein